MILTNFFKICTIFLMCKAYFNLVIHIHLFQYSNFLNLDGIYVLELDKFINEIKHQNLPEINMELFAEIEQSVSS